MNRKAAGYASPAVAASIKAHIDWLDEQIEAVMDEVRHLVALDPALSRNLALMRSITGFGEVSAVILLAELPNIAEFTPKPWPHSPASRPASTVPAPPYAGRQDLPHRQHAVVRTQKPFTSSPDARAPV